MRPLLPPPARCNCRRLCSPLLLQVGLLREKYSVKVGENVQLYNALLHAKRLLMQVCVWLRGMVGWGLGGWWWESAQPTLNPCLPSGHELKGKLLGAELPARLRAVCARP